MFNYAQLDTSGVVITVANLSGEVTVANMIRVDSYNTALLGQKYNTSTKQFEEVTSVN